MPSSKLSSECPTTWRWSGRNLILVPITSAFLVLSACSDPEPAGPPVDKSADATPETSTDIIEVEVGPEVDRICTPGVVSCADAYTTAVCNADGSGYDTAECGEGLTCWPDSAKCKLPNCEPTKGECRSVDTYRVCDEYGIQWGETLPCPADTFCDAGECVGCEIGAVECTSSLTFRSCPDGIAWTEEQACGDGMACVEDQCCTFSGYCDENGQAARTCVADGVTLLDEVASCVAPTQCLDGNCVSCIPGATQCFGESSYQECAVDGQSYNAPLPCAADKVCIGGACTADGCLPRVLLVVDRSGSMSSDWNNVAASITSLSASNPGYYGLIAFPGNGDSCGSSDTLDVPMGLNNSLELQSWMASHDPTGATPLLAVMDTLSWLAPTVLEGNPGTIVVLSDGDDSCANGNVANQLGPIAQTLYSQYQIVTYSIGYGYSGEGSSAELNALTANGGSGATKHVVAGDESELTNAFQGIIDDIKYCD